MAGHRRTTLLTGATGLVGGGLLGLLFQDPDRRVVVLARPGPRRDALAASGELASSARTTLLPGDLARPDLGLDASARELIVREVSEIVHCAADTRFDLPLETARAVNTAGTQALLDLARGCGRLEKFAHVSTVYVVGRASGTFGESPLRHEAGFYNTYQQSKYEAEELVVAAMSELPAVIVRLSSLIGDSRTGQVRQFNYVHQLMRLFPQNVLPIAPGLPSAPIDLIPTDWAIPALAHVVGAGFRPSSVHHICAGPGGSLGVSEMIDLTARAYAGHLEGRRWTPIRAPRLVSLAEFDAYVEARRKEPDRLLNELLRVLGYFLPHLGVHQAFENRKTLDLLEAVNLGEPPSIRAYYEKVVHYGLETRWGKRMAPWGRS
jgi:nucleoside-diphosphate-sugar epimerase